MQPGLMYQDLNRPCLFLKPSAAPQMGLSSLSLRADFPSVSSLKILSKLLVLLEEGNLYDFPAGVQLISLKLCDFQPAQPLVNLKGMSLNKLFCRLSLRNPCGCRYLGCDKTNDPFSARSLPVSPVHVLISLPISQVLVRWPSEPTTGSESPGADASRRPDSSRRSNKNLLEWCFSAFSIAPALGQPFLVPESSNE